MKVAILGANGQLGRDLDAVYRRRGDEVMALTHSDVEVADPESVDRALIAAAADLVVNASAMHNLPRCEQSPADAFAVNAVGVRNLALFSRAHGTPVVHVSTDYVFDGVKREPYVESDAARPLNVYGNSKLAGEHFVESVATRYFIVRTSGLFGIHPCRAKGLNFVELMLDLAGRRDVVQVVDDEFLTPTSTEALARQIAALADTDAYGRYHATAEGACSWYEFAREVFALSGISTPLEPARPGQFASEVARPKYSVLDNAALKSRGLNRLGPWQEELRRYLSSRAATVP